MNGDDHGSPLNNPDTSPFSDPQSPGLPHLHHHPTTADHDDPMNAAGLRRRHQAVEDDTSGPIAEHDSASSSSMRVRIQTPFSDLGESRRKEVIVDRAMLVSEMKDGLASGRWGEGTWVRDGMRLVWRGRVVRDEEAMGDIVRDVSQSSV